MWKSKPEDRLKAWKLFRKELSSMPLLPALHKVRDLWQSAPFTPYYLDSQDVKSWPDPWALVYENHYCGLAKGLGILYTLYFSDHRTESLELRIYQEPESGYEHTLVFVNGGEHILNHGTGEIVNIEQLDKSLTLCRVCSAKELKLEEY